LVNEWSQEPVDQLRYRENLARASGDKETADLIARAIDQKLAGGATDMPAPPPPPSPEDMGGAAQGQSGDAPEGTGAASPAEPAAPGRPPGVDPRDIPPPGEPPSYDDIKNLATKYSKDELSQRYREALASGDDRTSGILENALNLKNEMARPPETRSPWNQDLPYEPATPPSESLPPWSPEPTPPERPGELGADFSGLDDVSPGHSGHYDSPPAGSSGPGDLGHGSGSPPPDQSASQPAAAQPEASAAPPAPAPEPPPVPEPPRPMTPEERTQLVRDKDQLQQMQVSKETGSPEYNELQRQIDEKQALIDRGTVESPKVEGYEHADNATSAEAQARNDRLSSSLVDKNGNEIPQQGVDNADLQPAPGQAVVERGLDDKIANVNFGHGWTEGQKARFLTENWNQLSPKAQEGYKPLLDRVKSRNVVDD
jgi:hypothetical protein